MMFGEISAEELSKAQDTIAKVLHFICEKKDSKNADEKSAARAALALICLDHILSHELISMLAKDMSDSINEEQEAKKSNATHRSISIQIPIGEKS